MPFKIMENKKAFESILNFVSALYDTFGNKYKKNKEKCDPMILYYSFIHKDEVKNSNKTRDDIILGFKEFCSKYKTYIIENRLEDIPIKTSIKYNRNIYIDIQRYVKVCEKSIKDTIRNHLLKISNIILDDDAFTDEFSSIKSGINTKTNEGNFLGGMLDMLKEKMDENGIKQGDDPMSVISQMLKPEILGDLVNNIAQSVNNKDIDLGKMGDLMKDITGGMDIQGMMSNMNLNEITNGITPQSKDKSLLEFLENDIEIIADECDFKTYKMCQENNENLKEFLGSLNDLYFERWNKTSIGNIARCAVSGPDEYKQKCLSVLNLYKEWLME